MVPRFLTGLALFACASLAVRMIPAHAGSITLNSFNNDTPATVTFDDGAGHSGSQSVLLSQLNVTFSGGGSPITFNTFSVDLSHTVSVGQSYAVALRVDLATVFTNGSRIAYVFQHFGLENLTGDPIQAAAVQITLWDLSLNNHNPIAFGPDADGTYSSGDENIFSVSFGNNPDASQIASLTSQYLGASIGATTTGTWLDAAAAGNAPNRGESVLQRVPEPSSWVMVTLGVGALGIVLRLRKRWAGVAVRPSRLPRPR